jgi:hypothetical protein
MANTSISNLTAGAAVSATDLVPNVQTVGVGPVKTTAAQLKTFMSASPTLVTPDLGTPALGNFSTGTFTWPTFNQNTTGTAANVTGTVAVANGGTGVTTSTGTGDVVLSTSPTLVTPVLGTPTSGNFSTGTFTWPTFNQNTSGTAAGLSATLVVGSGGTGTSTAFTTGSVIFAGASGVYSQNNSALFWDNTNSRLGIGTASPGFGLVVRSAVNINPIVLFAGPSTGFRVGVAASAATFEAVDTTGVASYQPLNVNGSTVTIQTGGTARVDLDASGNVAIRNVATLASTVATPAGGSTSARLLLGTTAGFGIYYGSGLPTVSAAQGSIYIRSDGSSTSTRLYVNTNGSTTWTNFTSAA